MAPKFDGIIHFVDFAEAPDRSEFWRDAETAKRLSTHSDAADFLASLCRARAVFEMPDGADARQVSTLAQALLKECLARGFDSVPLRHIKLSVALSLPAL